MSNCDKSIVVDEKPKRGRVKAIVDEKPKRRTVKAIHEQVFDEGRWWFRTEWSGQDKKGLTWAQEWLWEEDLKDNAVFLACVAKHPLKVGSPSFLLLLLLLLRAGKAEPRCPASLLGLKGRTL